LVRTYYGHEGGITCLQFAHDSLLTGSIDKTIRHWDLETGQTKSVLMHSSLLQNTQSDSLLYPYQTTDNTFDRVLSEPDLAGWDDSLRKSIVDSTLAPHIGSYVGGLHFWEHALAAGYGDGIIRLFDLRTSQCHRSFAEHTATVTTVTFDDSQLLSGSLDKSIKVG
jgi:division protein 1